MQEARINRCVRNYPGWTGKDSLALDEWIEICNRDFSLLPSVRSLVGFCRQGSHVGFAKRCKRFVEVFYGPGDVDAVKVPRQGTGSKGNCLPEKKMIYEICCHFMADANQPLSLKSVWQLEPKIKTTLGRKKINDIESYSGVDSTMRLLNGVSHVYRSTGAGVHRSSDPDDACLDADGQLESMFEDQLRQRAVDAEKTMDSIVVP